MLWSATSKLPPPAPAPRLRLCRTAVFLPWVRSREPSDHGGSAHFLPPVVQGAMSLFLLLRRARISNVSLFGGSSLLGKPGYRAHGWKTSIRKASTAFNDLPYARIGEQMSNFSYQKYMNGARETRIYWESSKHHHKKEAHLPYSDAVISALDAAAGAGWAADGSYQSHQSHVPSGYWFWDGQRLKET